MVQVFPPIRIRTIRMVLFRVSPLHSPALEESTACLGSEIFDESGSESFGSSGAPHVAQVGMMGNLAMPMIETLCYQKCLVMSHVSVLALCCKVCKKLVLPCWSFWPVIEFDTSILQQNIRLTLCLLTMYRA